MLKSICLRVEMTWEWLRESPLTCLSTFRSLKLEFENTGDLEIGVLLSSLHYFDLFIRFLCIKPVLKARWPFLSRWPRRKTAQGPRASLSGPCSAQPQSSAEGSPCVDHHPNEGIGSSRKLHEDRSHLFDERVRQRASIDEDRWINLSHQRVKLTNLPLFLRSGALLGTAPPRWSLVPRRQELAKPQ